MVRTCRRSSYPRSMRKSSVATCASLAARGRRPLSIPEARKPSVSIMPGPSEFTRILRGPSSLLDITRSNAQTAETSPFPLDDSTTIAISDSPASASKIDCNSLAVHPQVGSTNEANLYTATLGRLFTGAKFLQIRVCRTLVARQGRRDSDKVSRNRQAPPPASLIRAPMPDRVDLGSN